MDHGDLARQATDALRKDLHFWLEIPIGVLPLFKELIMVIPNLLGDDLLNSPADVAGIARAKMKVINYALETGFTSKLLDSIGMGNDLLETVEEEMKLMSSTFQSVLEQSLAMLKESGESEDAVLAEMGLDEKLIEKCRQGLTVGELFRDHPTIIIQNT